MKHETRINNQNSSISTRREPASLEHTREFTSLIEVAFEEPGRRRFDELMQLLITLDRPEHLASFSNDIQTKIDVEFNGAVIRLLAFSDLANCQPITSIHKDLVGAINHAFCEVALAWKDSQPASLSREEIKSLSAIAKIHQISQEILPGLQITHPFSPCQDYFFPRIVPTITDQPVKHTCKITRVTRMSFHGKEIIEVQTDERPSLTFIVPFDESTDRKLRQASSSDAVVTFHVRKALKLLTSEVAKSHASLLTIEDDLLSTLQPPVTSPTSTLIANRKARGGTRNLRGHRLPGAINETQLSPVTSF